ncbi:cation:proton antiporter domain-containing protein [Paenibacillus silvisoli]|uniref:cation:proton antiporter domain-containing protein n=1 Tax=Paenibacillus silvisoli TaxID=3110539 RepID=UPI0028062736|nr:cation:proton antiporter [Paenibacillus silvisoli]
MSDNGTFGGLLLVLIVSFALPILLFKLHIRILPVVVAEILSGLVLGKSGFQIVVNNQWLSMLSLLGFIYLMFLSGLEIDFSILRPSSRRPLDALNPLLSAIIVFAGIFIASGTMSIALLALGFVKKVFLTTLIISTVSLGIVVPVLKERGLLSTALGQTLLLVTVLADFFTMILLAVYVSALSHSKLDMFLLFAFLLVLVVTYFIIRPFASSNRFKMLSTSTVQIGTRAIFTLLLGVVYLSEQMGVENILGAFLAGAIVSILKPQKAFIYQLESFGYGFLIPIFFVMVGVNLNIRPLLTDMKMLVLIPLLLLCMFLAKLVPMFFLKKWLTLRDIFSSAALLSAKLSLVIAAATLALELGILDERLHGAFILVAVISCLLFPVLFNKLAVQQETRKRTISIFGLNHISIPVISELTKDNGYDIRLFTANKTMYDNVLSGDELRIGGELHYLPLLTVGALDELRAFQSDVIVAATTKDEINAAIAEHAAVDKDKRVIVRIEEPELHKQMREKGMEVFSTLFAARRVLRALIENPGALRLISENEPLSEIDIGKSLLYGTMLKSLPIPPNVLILRIYRGKASIIPNGDTVVQRGDRLLLSGNADHIEQFRMMLS